MNSRVIATTITLLLVNHLPVRADGEHAALILTNNDAQLTASPLNVLYETGTERGRFEDWMLNDDWRLVGGKLLSSGKTSAYHAFDHTLAPYELKIDNYAVEEKILAINEDGNSFGIAIRVNGEDGYVAGVGRDWGNKSHICYLRGHWALNAIGACRAEGKTFVPGTKWHTYRVEVKENTIRLLVGGDIKVSLVDNMYLDHGKIGLWSSSWKLEVQQFMIIKLPD